MSSPILWNPTPELLKESEIAKYMRWLKTDQGVDCQTYQELHQWSIENIEKFWESIWNYMEPSHDSGYHEVLSNKQMPGATWFVGARFNFAKNLLQPCLMGNGRKTVLVALDEERNRRELTAEELLSKVTVFQHYLRQQGVKAGDRVAGILCNDEKTVIAMLAATSLGAVWASASPEFGAQALIDRLGEISPKVLFTVNGYSYNGKEYPIGATIENLLKEVPSIESVVWIPKILKPSKRPKANLVLWREIAQKKPQSDLTFVPLAFDHPVYILFSSGTTGKPKAIVHGAGGVMLQHFKELTLHGNITQDSVFSYYTTCGWMMWNWLVSGLMTGAKLVLYDGSPNYPSIERLWSMVENEGITHLGTSAKFISHCRMEELSPKRILSMESLENIFSTGSPLLEEDFDWIFAHIKKQVQLTSISGGTDILSCFVLGNPISPIYRGEIQCKGLGMDVVAMNEDGVEVLNQKGELVCKQPTPSMPLYFLNDPEGKKYQQAYFEKFEDLWCHGDYVSFNEHGGCQILGRSDTTLNPGGVRIGTAEIYRGLESCEEIMDCLVTSIPKDGDEDVVLLVQIKPGFTFSQNLVQKIQETIKNAASPRHVPKHVFQVSEIPYTLSGKKVELAVRHIFQGKEVVNVSAIKNPRVLDEIEQLKSKV